MLKGWILSLLWIAILSYLGFGLLLYLSQRHIIYYPTAQHDIAGVQQISLSINGESLLCHLVNPGKSQGLLYFGGNAEAVGYNASQLARLLPKHSIYLVNYRGYGGSSGEPSEQALFSDALAIYDHLRPDFDSLSVIGRSLGSSVATYLASQRTVHSLVLITPFSSLEQLARDHYPIYPMSLLLQDKFRSVDYADKVTSDTLLLLAENDEIINQQHTPRLLAAFRKIRPKLITIDAADHNDISAYPAFEQALKAFFSNPKPSTDK